jgi:hypothetical protein
MKRIYLGVFLVFWGGLSFFASGTIDSLDGFQYLAIARQIYHFNSFAMPAAELPQNIHLNSRIGTDGVRYSPTGLGYSLALIPAVVAEDIFLRSAGLPPIADFPLNHDWPVLLFASFVNPVFGALLAAILYAYGRRMGLSNLWSFVLVIMTMLGTNLLVYTKHAFAQMMFLTFMMWSFYWLKTYSQSHHRHDLMYAGLSFGVVMISYNPTFLLLVPAMGLYYLGLWFNSNLFFIQNLRKVKFWWESLGKWLLDGLYFMLGWSPLFLLYSWYNSIRFGGVAASGYRPLGKSLTLPSFPPAYVIFEGIWGILLSPGKGLIIYSPLLLLLILFWHKLKNTELPEIFAAGWISLAFIWISGTTLGAPDFLIWSGGASWGPRYILPIIPMLMLLVGVIVARVSKLSRVFVVLPLFMLGLWFEVIGVLLPYQIRFRAFELDSYISGRKWNVEEYGNFLPRYAPPYVMSKTLIKSVLRIPDRYLGGKYQIKLHDGFGDLFSVGHQYWRGVFPSAVIKITDTSGQVENIELSFINQQISAGGSHSAQLAINVESMNEFPVDPLIIESNKTGVATISARQLSDNTQIVLNIERNFVGTSSANLDKSQVVFLTQLKINDEPQSLQQLSGPFVSPISQSLYDVEYGYFGNQENYLWRIWHHKSRMYEERFDLWWMLPVVYWDLPRHVFVLIGTVFAVITTSGVVVLWISREQLK